MPNTEWKLMSLLPSQLKTDLFYQREINARHSRDIIKNFDPRCIDFPLVNLRDDGKYYVINGDHTVQAWFTKYGDTPIQCVVYTGMTREEEAQLFLAKNRSGSVKPLTALQRINTRLNLKDPEIVDMVSIASMSGVSIGFKKGNECYGRCVAPDAMYKVYKEHGREVLLQTLTTIVQAWKGEEGSLRSGFIQGIGLLYRKYGSSLKRTELVNSLKRQEPDWYIRQANNISSGVIATKYARVFLGMYNKSRTTNRLEDKL